MKIDRVKNTKRNIFYGIVGKIVSTVFPFVLRTVLLYELGAQYLGLNSLFGSILGVLSLTELGVGSAMVYAMYKPIAEDDTEKVCALLKLYRDLYRVIGVVMLVAGLCVVPFLKLFIKGSYPADINLYLLYGIYLFNSVISYFLFAYKQSILQAYQRNDIISKNTSAVQIVMYIIQIIVIYLFNNYYYYILLIPVFTIFNNYVNSAIVDREYPKYKCHGDVSKEEKIKIKKNVLALIGTKLSSVILHSSDNLVISAFLVSDGTFWEALTAS